MKNLKKLMALVLGLALALSICACGNNPQEENQTQSKDPVNEPEYYEECTVLPTLDSVISGVKSNGRSRTSSNGVVTKIEYRYSSDEDISTAYDAYINYLKEVGIEIQSISLTENSIIDNQMKVASVKLESDSIIVNIIPEDFRVVAIVKNLSEGASESLDFAELSFKKIEISKEVYPEDTSSTYLYYEESPGYSYVTLRGKVKNTSNIDLEGRYINAFVTINGEYTYDCEVIFGSNPAAMTDYAIAPFEKSPLYVVAQIPEEAISMMKEGVFTVQFNDNFEQGAGEYRYTYNFVIPD